MPVRFSDENVTCLKRVMLTRFPECKFTQEDYKTIMEETGLEHERIMTWAQNVRSRLPEEMDRKIFLSSGKIEKVT